MLSSPLGTRYVADLDRLFDTYAELVPRMEDWYRERHPQEPGRLRTSSTGSRSGPRRSTPCGGCCRRPSLSNVGIYGTGQGYEQLLLRMRASALPEARAYAELMLGELRKVIPSFLTRVDRPERGGEWSAYLAATARATAEVAEPPLRRRASPSPGPRSPSSTSTPRPRTSCWPPCSTPTSTCPTTRSWPGCARLSAAEREAVAAAYVGDRRNRRHKPGRALETVSYRFDVLSDYGAFRDLQRHRMLTIQWQPLDPAPRLRPARPTWSRPGSADRFEEAMARSAGAATTPWPAPSRPRPPTPSPWPTGCGTRSR